MTGPRVLWVDASAGVAGDMLLGALVDLGVPLQSMQDAVDAVLPGAATLTASTVTRAGLRATKVEVALSPSRPAAPSVPASSGDAHRTWASIRELVGTAALDPTVREAALRTFERLAVAEGHVHGIPAADVHFHEVGAVDAIADVVGTCAGLAALELDEVVLSPVALGAGTVRSQHGTLAVPAPAVLELSRGWDVTAGSADMELATPTGLALVTQAAGRSGSIPAMRVAATGIGAGTKDRPDRANVVRLVLGTTTEPSGGQVDPAQDVVLLETNVDDLDPRVWPDVLARLLAEGALDAWLTPILMKKGRPAHTLHVLAAPGDERTLADLVLTHTSTLGLRVSRVGRDVLDRSWTPVAVLGEPVRVKLGHRDGRLVQVMPEFEDVADLAHRNGSPVAVVLAAARSAAAAAGLVAGAAVPSQRE